MTRRMATPRRRWIHRRNLHESESEHEHERELAAREGKTDSVTVLGYQTVAIDVNTAFKLYHSVLSYLHWLLSFNNLCSFMFLVTLVCPNSTTLI